MIFSLKVGLIRYPLFQIKPSPKNLFKFME
nr:MAG TPA: hypothetical protein [Caudoviricetes sp.]